METESLTSADPLSWGLVLNPPDVSTLIGLLIFLLLLMLSALISGSEVAYFSLSPADKLNLGKSKRDTKVAEHLHHPERLLATILVVNNFVNIAIVILGAFITSSLLEFYNAPILEFLIQVVIITFLLLLFGEILPKVYATHYPLGFARFMAYPLFSFELLFQPINSILIRLSELVNQRLNRRQRKISINEISQALELTSESDNIQEKEILEGIVRFGNKNVSEIMRSRVDVVAIDIRTTFDEVLEVINQTGYSRLPVYAQSFDHVKGMLFIKDLLPHTEKGSGFNWQSLLRPPFFVPETRKIKALLEDFQKNKVHMAVVVDEYGGSSGIVTLEDILEEIVGDIADEFDDDERYFKQIGDGKYLFDGKTLLTDFCRVTQAPEDIFDNVKGEADTLAGLVLELRGEFPSVNEKITCKNFRLTIESINKRRIKQIRVETLTGDE